jgi:hypothetical protein
MVYYKVAEKVGVIQKAPYNPWSHRHFDENINFHHIGTMWKYRDVYKEITTPSAWEGYLQYLKDKSVQNGIDYFKLYE